MKSLVDVNPEVATDEARVVIDEIYSGETKKNKPSLEYFVEYPELQVDVVPIYPKEGMRFYAFPEGERRRLLDTYVGTARGKKNTQIADVIRRRIDDITDADDYNRDNLMSWLTRNYTDDVALFKFNEDSWLDDDRDNHFIRALLSPKTTGVPKEFGDIVREMIAQDEAQQAHPASGDVSTESKQPGQTQEMADERASIPDDVRQARQEYAKEWLKTNRPGLVPKDLDFTVKDSVVQEIMDDFMRRDANRKQFNGLAEGFDKSSKLEGMLPPPPPPPSEKYPGDVPPPLPPPPLPPEAARIERNYEDARDYTLRHAKHEFDEDVAEAIAVRLEAIDMLGDPYEKTDALNELTRSLGNAWNNRKLVDAAARGDYETVDEVWKAKGRSTTVEKLAKGQRKETSWFGRIIKRIRR